MLINIINVDPDATLQGVLPNYREVAKKAREDRMLSIAKQSKEQGFGVRFWPGVTHNKFAHYNISESFRNIVAYAKQHAYEHVCIGEDDLVFTAPGACRHYFYNKPDRYDIYLGGLYAGQLAGNRVINGYSGHTLITIHNSFYDFVLSANPQEHLDRWLGNFAFEKEYIVCLPFVIKQMPGYSDNKGRMAEYEAFEKNWQYYEEAQR